MSECSRISTYVISISVVVIQVTSRELPIGMIGRHGRKCLKFADGKNLFEERVLEVRRHAADDQCQEFIVQGMERKTFPNKILVSRDKCNEDLLGSYEGF